MLAMEAPKVGEGGCPGMGCTSQEGAYVHGPRGGRDGALSTRASCRARVPGCAPWSVGALLWCSRPFPAGTVTRPEAGFRKVTGAVQVGWDGSDG